MVTVKILHLLSMATGVGFGLAGLVMLRMFAGAGPETTGVVMRARVRLGQLSLLSLIVLWITGGMLWGGLHAYAPLSTPFVLKLLLVAALTIVSGWLNYVAFRAARGGPRPDPLRMAQLAKLASLLAVLIVALATVVFSG